MRKLISKGSATLAIKGLVTDATSGDGLKGAKLVFAFDGESFKSANGNNGFEKKTAAKGGFMVSKAADGNYTVTVSLPGYKQQTATVSLVTGQMSVLNIQMEKI